MFRFSTSNTTKGKLTVAHLSNNVSTLEHAFIEIN
jgi:hypothetical protein